MNRCGVYSINNDEIIVHGFGLYIGEKTIYNDEIGIEVSYPCIKIDNGIDFLCSDCIVEEEEIAKQHIEEFKHKNFSIIYASDFLNDKK